MERIELVGEEQETHKGSLDESLVRNVLFAERKKPVEKEQPKKKPETPELRETKEWFKSLIVEAWDELV